MQLQSYNPTYLLIRLLTLSQLMSEDSIARN